MSLTMQAFQVLKEHLGELKSTPLPDDAWDYKYKFPEAKAMGFVPNPTKSRIELLEDLSKLLGKL